MKFSYLLLSLLMIIFCSRVSAQEKYTHATIFLKKGRVVEGEIKKEFFHRGIKQKLRVYTGDKIRPYRFKRIDSLYANDQVYRVDRTTSIPYLLKEIDKGAIELYLVDSIKVGLKRNGSVLHLVPRKKYTEAYNLFVSNSLEAKQTELTKEDFISLVKEHNTSFKAGKSVPYDSIRESSEPVLLRLSFLWPEVGLELKLSRSLTLYNALGIHQIRGIQPYIGYNYSGEFRYFYRNNIRLKKGKDIYNFSGPFLALSYDNFIDRMLPSRHVFGIMHGWQRSNLLTSTFNNLRIGVGFDPVDYRLYFLSGLNLGWVF